MHYGLFCSARRFSSTLRRRLMNLWNETRFIAPCGLVQGHRPDCSQEAIDEVEV